jgi:hypothetical protein
MVGKLSRNEQGAVAPVSAVYLQVRAGVPAVAIDLGH